MKIEDGSRLKWNGLPQAGSPFHCNRQQIEEVQENWPLGFEMFAGVCGRSSAGIDKLAADS
ncbi:MAG: hypothetical protein M3O31_03160 [Acidobacteriota bacterium]|nr:hypothetical protein [Acidobacteriota bacterium]